MTCAWYTLINIGVVSSDSKLGQMTDWSWERHGKYKKTAEEAEAKQFKQYHSCHRHQYTVMWQAILTDLLQFKFGPSQCIYTLSSTDSMSGVWDLPQY